MEVGQKNWEGKTPQSVETKMQGEEAETILNLFLTKSSNPQTVLLVPGSGQG